MKKLKDYKHLFSDDAIKWVESWVSQGMDARVYFVHTEYEDSNWYTACLNASDLYGANTQLKEDAYCISLPKNKQSTKGCKATFYGGIRHFVKECAANIAYRHGHRYHGNWCDNPFFNYEYMRRVEHWLNYRYGFSL